MPCHKSSLERHRAMQRAVSLVSTPLLRICSSLSACCFVSQNPVLLFYPLLSRLGSRLTVAAHGVTHGRIDPSLIRTQSPDEGDRGKERGENVLRENASECEWVCKKDFPIRQGVAEGLCVAHVRSQPAFATKLRGHMKFSLASWVAMLPDPRYMQPRLKWLTAPLVVVRPRRLHCRVGQITAIIRRGTTEIKKQA